MYIVGIFTINLNQNMTKKLIFKFNLMVPKVVYPGSYSRLKKLKIKRKKKKKIHSSYNKNPPVFFSWPKLFEQFQKGGKKILLKC